MWETSRNSAYREPMTCYLGSNSIGCTKIMETIWMVESKRMVSGNARWKNFSVWLPNATTHRTENPGEILTTLSVELDDIQAWKWNSERVIVFQSVILKRAQYVNNTKHICVRIHFRLDCCNCGVIEKLVKFKQEAATGFMGETRSIQSKDQRYRMFSNLFLKGKLRKAVIFFCARETGGGVQPDKLAEDITGIINEAVAYFLMGEYMRKQFPPVLSWRHTMKPLYLLLWTLQRMQSNWSRQNYQEVLALEDVLRSFICVNFIIYGGHKKTM